MSASGRLNAEMLSQVASMFRVLGDPSRLEILQSLMSGSKSVSEVVGATGKGQANVSKHLAVLSGAGIVSRTPKGTQAIYEVVDPLVFGLCDMVCKSVLSRISREVKVGKKLLSRG